MEKICAGVCLFYTLVGQILMKIYESKRKSYSTNIMKGVDIIQFNAAGQIVDFEVMVRPADGLQALGAAVAQQLASADLPKIES